MLEREAAAVAEALHDRVEAAGGRAGEQAAGVVGDGDVRQAGEVDVEHGVLRPGRAQRADHGEGGEVDAGDGQAGLGRGGDEAVDHLAAHGDDDHAVARAVGRVDLAERLEVEHGLVHRHRDVVRRRGADGLLQRLRVVDHRHVERAHDDALVGHAEADRRREIVVGEELAELLGQRDRVGDLAVAEDARTQLGDGALRDRHATLDVDLCGSEVARIHLEPDDGLVLTAA